MLSLMIFFSKICGNVKDFLPEEEFDEHWIGRLLQQF